MHLLNRLLQRRLGFGVLTLGIVGALQAAPSPVAPLSQLVALVAQRNAIAHDVAANKYPRDVAVVDAAREQIVLQRKREQAIGRGLDPEAVVGFYMQLIEANKLVQHADFYRYRLGRVPPPAPTLDQIRQRIDHVDAQLLDLWPHLQGARADLHCTARTADTTRHWLRRHPGTTQAERLALVRSLVGFCVHDGKAQRSAIDELP